MTALRLGLAAVGHPSHIPVILGCRPKGGLGLIYGEAQGLGIDFTDSLGNSGVGSVAVRDAATPANNLSNVPAGDFLTNSGTSPKYVRNSAGTYVWTAHNILVKSQTLGTSWATASNVTVASNDITAPDGTLTAEKVTEAATTATHRLAAPAVAAVQGASYTLSASFKKGTRDWQALWITSTD